MQCCNIRFLTSSFLALGGHTSSYFEARDKRSPSFAYKMDGNCDDGSLKIYFILYTFKKNNIQKSHLSKSVCISSRFSTEKDLTNVSKVSR